MSTPHSRSMWRRCLESAFRTAMACGIVAGVTLYGPQFINRQVAFPAFSYVTVMLILTDASLGHTLRCCWLALYATVQGVLPAILCLWLIGPQRLAASSKAVVVAVISSVVAVSAFLVALPENTHVTSKRIALGQIVIVYVVGFVNGERTEPVMHPVHVAASTAVGVAACVLAMVVPYPSLALFEVKENCRLFVNNASERLNLFVRSFSAEDITLTNSLISQAKSLKVIGGKLLCSIKSKKASMQWEILPVKVFKSFNTNQGERLQDLETVLGGMEIALTNCTEFPVRILNSEIKNEILAMEENVLNQVKNTTLENTKSEREMEPQFLQTLQGNNISLTRKDLPSLFFIFCMKLLQTKLSAFPPNGAAKQVPNESQKMWGNFSIGINKSRLRPALKCSLSLGFAVLFGLIYSKENGFWAGLPVAISFASSREATFRTANVKAQGTVLGTVYGVICCFIFEKYVKIRFISLLPWFVFCSFLRRSRMYGQAGGISAVIGAVLILGRKDFGTPSQFAIARIVETFIGLSCPIVVDILLQPTRASVLAKVHLSMSLQSLRDSVGSITLDCSCQSRLQESRMKLKSHVSKLGKFIEEAELEPNFWFLPFHNACFTKLMGSLSKMVEFLQFGCQALAIIDQESRKLDGEIWKAAAAKVEGFLKLLKNAILARTKCFEGISMVGSLELLEREFEKRNNSVDLEMGNSATQYLTDDGEMENNTDSFLQHLEEILSAVGTDEEQMQIQMVLSLTALVFCMNGLLKELKEIEKEIKELVQWENPTRQVDLQQISSQIQALEIFSKD